MCILIAAKIVCQFWLGTGAIRRVNTERVLMSGCASYNRAANAVAWDICPHSAMFAVPGSGVRAGREDLASRGSTAARQGIWRSA